MKLLIAFFRLVRWPNLVFIALTQSLFYYCIIVPLLPKDYIFTQRLFFLLVTASVLIAAGGYIINDYFDINIDQVNKPGKMVVEKIINRRWAILLHLMITTIGVGISLYVSLKTNIIVIIANITCTLLLWFYSTTFKKKLLSGNIMISALTAWTVFVLYFTAVNSRQGIFPAMHSIYKLAALYAGFAFIISLIREVVKDIEDMEGDAKYDCKTIPIVWGVPAAKVFVGVWLVVLIGALAVVQFYVLFVLQTACWGAVYCILFVILPLLWILKFFYMAQTSAQFHQLSLIIKMVMLTGVLSMFFFKLSA